MKKTVQLLLLAFAFSHCSPNQLEQKKLPKTKALNQLMDQWHEAAANADSSVFFDFMDDAQFHYLGTDPSENWNKTDFKAFALPYFRKGKAWDFTPTNRHWYYNENRDIAWFDESLDTWMKECRGSGVVGIVDDEIKLLHYNLALTLENEKIQAFINLKDSL